MKISMSLGLVAAMCSVALSSAALAQPSSQPWLDGSLSAEARAHALVGAMTTDEKLKLIFGYGSPDDSLAKVPDTVISAEAVSSSSGKSASRSSTGSSSTASSPASSTRSSSSGTQTSSSASQSAATSTQSSSPASVSTRQS